MLDPLPLRIHKALTASLEEISVASGYQHDLAGAVFRGRLQYDKNDPLPMVSILQPPTGPEELESPTASSAKATKHPLLLQGFADEDRKNPTDPAYHLLADVLRRLAEERARDEGFDILGFGPRIRALHVGQYVIRPPDQVVSDTAFFWLPITLEYAEDLRNPFA